MIEYVVAAVIFLALAVLVVRERLRARRVERRVNRRLVAYEGKLRELGYAPDRVYHDFENMLAGNDEREKSPEFESDVREEDDGG